MAKMWWGVAALVASTSLLASCAGSSSISVDELQQQIAIKLSTGNNNNNVIRLNAVKCYDPLPKTTGSQVRCSITENGAAFWVTATSKGEIDGATDFELVFDNGGSIP